MWCRRLVLFFAVISLLFPLVSSTEVQVDNGAASSSKTAANNDNDVSSFATAANGTTCFDIDGGTERIAFIPPIDPTNEKIVREYFFAGVSDSNTNTNHNIPSTMIQPLHPIGAAVTGIDLSRDEEPPEHVTQALETVMAERGFVVFKGQDQLQPEELVRASQWWGGGAVYSTHGVHRATPRDAQGNVIQDVLRISNDKRQGIVGVGPQWHHDGSFLSGTFSHVAYHIVQVPHKRDAGTHFAHLGAAYDALTTEQQDYWSRLASVNSNSGAVHPVVHEHYLSKRKSVWLHLGLTGAVIEKKRNGSGYRTLNELELTKFMNEYNDLLNAGFREGYAIAYEYEPGDCIITDNLAVAHRASPAAHLHPREQGLRILHRVTIHAVQDFPPTFVGDDQNHDDDNIKDSDNLPQFMDMAKPNPFNDGGVWLQGGVGYRWDDEIALQN